MTFSSLALKNIHRNFKNYLLYIFSVTIAITFYYIFCSIKYNSQIMFAADTSQKFQVIMNMSSVVLVLFTAVFIWYCNAFFTKKRKKEVALYTLLGVPKQRVARMLFIENMLVMVLSLTLGILIGILFSKFFMMLVLKLMEIPVEVGFSVPLRAVLDTGIIFVILFVVASIHSASLIYRFQIIELFSASKKVEKEPKTSFILSLASIACLGLGYYLSQHMLNQYLALIALAVLLLVILGTFGLFSSVIVTFTKSLKRFEGFYYKGDHLIAISNIVYRIRTHARTLALIAILSATTLTAFGVCYSFFFDYDQSTHNRYPHAYIYQYDDLSQENKIASAFMDTIGKSDHPLVYEYNIEASIIPLEVVSEDTNTNKENAFYIPQNRDAYFVSESTANLYLKSHHLSEISVPSGEFIAMDPYAAKGWYDYSSIKQIYTANQSSHELKISSVLPYYLTTQRESPVYILEDDAYNQLNAPLKTYFHAYSIQDDKKAGQLDEALSSIVNSYEGVELYSFYKNYINLGDMKGLMLFSGIFMGIVFLILTGSILYFKMINEAEEDQDKYTIMRKIGYSHPMIKQAIYKQMAVMFSLPIILGILHALFALRAFETLMMSSLVVPILISVGMYIFIYLCFYFLTVQYYYRTAISGK
ncbi:FtsX-like permease family protein [Fusibacter sp. 3D3]|uniref:FtsX-like permease family protein n=1 Tax=Fusibacter sp. 3D3 TaxID=1048380 RepID=UPI0008532044|nr:ABC transporter permease [Fusibacter sp. 3D3]GAU78137.1 bacitracin export permease protein BceB [Fusibacter sp. 3D3]